MLTPIIPTRQQHREWPAVSNCLGTFGNCYFYRLCKVQVSDSLNSVTVSLKSHRVRETEQQPLGNCALVSQSLTSFHKLVLPSPPADSCPYSSLNLNSHRISAWRLQLLSFTHVCGHIHTLEPASSIIPQPPTTSPREECVHFSLHGV